MMKRDPHAPHERVVCGVHELIGPGDVVGKRLAWADE